MRKKVLFAVLTIALIMGTLPVNATVTVVESNWAIGFNLKYNNSDKVYTMESVTADFQGGKAGSLSITYPHDLTLNQTTPKEWTKVTKSTSETATATERVVAFDISESATEAEVKAYLKSISFKAAKTNSKETIKVAVSDSKNATIPYIHEDGTTHYYSCIKGVISWTDAYNAAKNSTFMGQRGYLATITSKEEQNYVWDSIAQTSGWLGGTKYLKNNKEKIKDDSKLSEVPETDGNDKEFYWACGPEAGTVFYNPSATRRQVNTIDGKKVFNWFKDGQPDGEAGGEGFLEFAFGESAESSATRNQWNDLANVQENWGLCYYVEYGGYSSETPAASGSTYATAKGKSLAYTYEMANKKDAKYSYGNGNITAEKLAEITSVKLEGINGETVPLTLNMSDLEALNAAIHKKKKGDYVLRYTTEAGEEFSVTVTLVGSTIESTTNKLTAGSGEITKEEIINKAGIVVTDADGHPIDPSKMTVNQDQLDELNKAIKNKKAGKYKVTLYAPDGTPYVVTVTVPGSGTNGNGSGTNSKTGDNSNMPGAFAVLFAAGATMMLAGKKNLFPKRKTRETK